MDYNSISRSIHNSLWSWEDIPNSMIPDEYIKEKMPANFLGFSPWGSTVISYRHDDMTISDEQNKGKTKLKRVKPEAEQRVAFRMQSERDDMEDGYKWKKYGKKFVKNNPNPRHYYKCSTSGCMVKKRVERDAHDKRFLVIAYHDEHNHPAPKTFNKRHRI